MKDELEQFLKQKIVLDTRSSWVYIGILEAVTQNCVFLSDVDVHDNNDTHTSKERYVLDSRTTGVKSNRDGVYVNIEYIVSFSLLKDVKSF